jgi:hypothetical protein
MLLGKKREDASARFLSAFENLSSLLFLSGAAQYIFPARPPRAGKKA